MKLIKSNLSEKLIINKYLKKLNFKNKGTFDFENDGAYLELKNKIKIVFNDYLNISKSLVSQKETKLINAIIQKYIDKNEINKK